MIKSARCLVRSLTTMQAVHWATLQWAAAGILVVKSLRVPRSSTAYLRCSQQVLDRCKVSSPDVAPRATAPFASAALALLLPTCNHTRLLKHAADLPSVRFGF